MKGEIKMEKLEILKILLDTNTKIIEMERKVENIKIDTESFYEKHNIALTDLVIDTLVDIQLERDGISGWQRDTKEYKHKPCLLTIFDMMLESEMPVGVREFEPINEETIKGTDMNKFNWQEYEKYEIDNQYDYITPVVLHTLSIEKLYGNLFSDALYELERYFHKIYKIEREKFFEGGYDTVKEQLKLLKDFKKELTLELEKVS
jgi:hypothetical protein